MSDYQAISPLDAKAWTEEVADTKPLKKPTQWAFSMLGVQFWCNHPYFLTSSFAFLKSFSYASRQ